MVMSFSTGTCQCISTTSALCCSLCGVKNALPYAEAILTAGMFALFQNTIVSTIHGFLAFQAQAMHFLKVSQVPQVSQPFVEGLHTIPYTSKCIWNYCDFEKHFVFENSFPFLRQFCTEGVHQCSRRFVRQ